MDIVTTDIESYYDKQYSLKKMTPEEYIRDPQFGFVGVSAALNDGEEVSLFTDSKKELREWYLDQFPLKAVWLAHNMSGFDSLVLTHHLDIHPKFWACTVAMGRLLHGRAGLAHLSNVYGLEDKGSFINEAAGKRYRDLTSPELLRYISYCRNDTRLCRQLFHLMVGEVPGEEMQLINLFTRMFAEPRVELDEHGLQLYHNQVRKKKYDALLRAGEYVGEEGDYNIEHVQKLLRSDKKFAAILREYGVEPPTKISPRTGKEAYAFAKTDEAMKELQDHPNEAVATLASVRVGVKTTIEESRVERFRGIATRGKLPALFLYGKTHTNRAAGGGKINLQNMTRSKEIVLSGEGQTPVAQLIYTPDGPGWLRARNKKLKKVAVSADDIYDAGDCTVYGLRHALMAPGGYKMVVADSSNIELRVAHALSNQSDVIERLRNDEDMYSWFASQYYGYEVTKKSHPFERFHGKVAMLQLQYQSGWKGFLRAAGNFGLKLERPRAENTVHMYRRLFQHVVHMWRVCERAIRAMEAGQEMAIDPWGLCWTEYHAIRLPNGTRMRYKGLRREVNDEGGWQWVYTDKGTGAPRTVYGGKVFENLCQALARIVVFQQMLEIEKRWGVWQETGMDTGVVLTAHDEVATIVRESDAMDCLNHSLDVMKTPPVWWPELPLDAEGDVAQCYGAAK